jgi:hypothetical protein
MGDVQGPGPGVQVAVAVPVALGEAGVADLPPPRATHAPASAESKVLMNVVGI